MVKGQKGLAEDFLQNPGLGLRSPDGMPLSSGLNARETVEYQRALRLKQELLSKHCGARLEEVLGGEEHHTELGACYMVETRSAESLWLPDAELVRQKVLKELRLLRGVGDAMACRLREKGYCSIMDLQTHPRFREDARRLIELLEGRDAGRLMELVLRWFSGAHPLVLACSALAKREDILILDIETLGLFAAPVILVGVAKLSSEEILVTQYVARHPHEEAAALAALMLHIKGNCVLVSFNGRMFDLPYIRRRIAHHGICADLAQPHVDVIYQARRAWRKKLPNCKLSTLEQYILGEKRDDDIPSAMVPDFYESYLATGNVGPLVAVVEHNKRDLLGLARVFSKLQEECVKEHL